MNEFIRPSSTLRNKYSELVRECRETNSVAILTVNGSGDSAIMSLDKYYALKDELQLYKELAEAENDVREGRISPADETYASIRKKIMEMEL